jgi:beta-lactamase class A
MNNFIENKKRSQAIAHIVKQHSFDKKVSELSIAIIDLKNNPTEIFGINLDSFLYPASVFKIFIGAEVLRQVEAGKYSLGEKLIIKQAINVPTLSNLYPDPRSLLKTGESVSIDHLLKLMLADSDNTASNCLLELAGAESITKHVIAAHAWIATGITDEFLSNLKQSKASRYVETTKTCARDVAEFFALVEEERLISLFVSRKLKEYMLQYNHASKHGYTIPDFIQYRKGGYMETNLYTSFYRKSGFGFDSVKGFGSLIKNIFTKGWAFLRYMHDAGVVEGKNSKYVVVVFTLSKQLNPRKYFHMDELAKVIFEYMEKDAVSMEIYEARLIPN